MSIPEPLSFNGGPDDTGREIKQPTGPRRDGDDVPNLRGSACHTCGYTIHRVYTLADVGAFCSPGCRNKATRLAVDKEGAA
jgi:hypothetical protein